MLLTYKKLKSIYREVNESVFDSQLPSYKIFIRTEKKDDDFDTCYAWFEEDAATHRVNGIVFNQFDWWYPESGLTKEEYGEEEKYEDEKEVLATVIHEMIHAWMHFIGHPEYHENEHGATFLGWADFAATKFNLTRDDIISPDTYE